MVQTIIAKVLGREAKLGDSLVDMGVDSMTSMSLYAALCNAVGDVEIPSSIFYDQPTVLDVATFVHSKTIKGTENESDETEFDASLEAMLEDPEARQSYRLGVARKMLQRGDRNRALEQCTVAVDIGGPGLASALTLQAEVLDALGDIAVGPVYAQALQTRERTLGCYHPDTWISLARSCQWEERAGTSDVSFCRQRFVKLRRLFFRYVCWSAEVWPPDEEPAPTRFLFSLTFSSLKTLHMDALGLTYLPKEVARFSALESWRVRRNRLRSLPHEVGALHRLSELWLTCNVLEDLQSPWEIGQTRQLVSPEWCGGAPHSLIPAFCVTSGTHTVNISSRSAESKTGRASNLLSLSCSFR